MSGIHKTTPARSWRLAMGFAGVLAVFPLAAQQSPTAPPPPQQEPGTGAQVHTGTSVGLDADARMLGLLADHQYLRAIKELDKLPPEDAQLYSGVLANRNNNSRQSIQLLEPLIDKATAGGNTAHEKLLRKSLAEDYLRIGDWAKAAAAYQALETRMEGKLSVDERDEIEMPLKLLPLAAGTPPMTVDPCDPFVLQVSRNPLGLTDVPVFVDARSHTWMLDPTAPFNLISRSIAHNIGLKVSEQAATIHTLTGRPMQVHVTVIPRFTLGGRITFHNMTAFVFDDADYTFPHSHYQVQGVLGYPALSALDTLTITANSTIEVVPANQNQPQSNQQASSTGARFFLDGDQMIVALGAAGNERMYVLDAAGQQSYLTSRYYNEHSSEFAGQNMQLFTVPGPQNLAPQPAYIAEAVPVAAGSNTVDVHYIQVLTQPLGSVALDDVYGILGVDVLEQLRGYTFDYKNMRFSVGPD